MPFLATELIIQHKTRYSQTVAGPGPIAIALACCRLCHFKARGMEVREESFETRRSSSLMISACNVTFLYFAGVGAIVCAYVNP
ncbi:hypothetical protein BCR37DRAFT_383624 [Protomyces lactucae-debilis]|uniref:Uncharacterized protein n=1 Tax=Protomyces lactucae-debilis TaxID=2754530 RepID=A0A1Y2EWW1_PROLT|nr:uncharacterized protein BCR37DRAFT_383624 [Protomyces lactucae-debilis]ORY76069.1 hypothetical protein BCR37DRAFT_383624 [Protomyces lactucae-debilis]